MQITCGHCQKVIEFSGDRPGFCGYCGRPLSESSGVLADTLPGPLAPLPAPPPAQTIGQYRLLRELGQGGMGVVWEAEQAGTGRRVALKLLSPRLPRTPETVERFLREGRLAASLSHPRSTFVFEAGQHGDQPYIVMELMPGRTLKDVVQQEGPLPVGRAVDYILQAIEGLEAAHDLGIIHRDVKPSNCFLDVDGRVKVGDFGLSKSLIHSAALTRTGAFLGTPEFAAPEQVRAGALDPRTDVYAVGATLFYLLTGRGPFQGDAAAVIAQIASDPAPRLRELRPQSPAALETAVAQSLEKDPARRFASLGALRQALLPFSTGGTTIADVGRRLAAFALDTVAFSAATVVFWLLLRIVATIVGRIAGSSAFPHVLESARWAEFLPFAFLLGQMAYHLIGEGLWGGTLGKRWLGLRVDAAQGGPAGFRRALVRTLFLPGTLGISAAALVCLAVWLPAIVPAPPAAPAKSSSGARRSTAKPSPSRRARPAVPVGRNAAKPSPPASGAPVSKARVPGAARRARSSAAKQPAAAPVIPPLRRPLTCLALLAPLYVVGAACAASMRSRNGYRGLHDVASDTHVVRVTPRFGVTRKLQTPLQLAATVDKGLAFGPFQVTGDVGSSAGSTILLGRDHALNRAVWIFISPPNLPPPPPARLSVTRSARPRWLQGGQAQISAGGDAEPPDHWDAYEAVAGAPLTEVAAHSGFDAEFGRRLVLELAEELAAAAADGTLPSPLTLDQVWVDRGGRIKLLDWPVHRLAGLGRSRPSRLALRPRALPARVASRADFNPRFGPVARRRKTAPSRRTASPNSAPAAEPTPAPDSSGSNPGSAHTGAAAQDAAPSPSPFQAAADLLLAAFALGMRKGILTAGARSIADEFAKRPPGPDSLAWAAEQLRAADSQMLAVSAADRLAMLGVSLAAEAPIYLAIAFLLIGAAWTVPGMDELFYVALPWLACLLLVAGLAAWLRGGPAFRLLGVEVQTGGGVRAGRWRCAWRDLLAWAPGMMSLCVLAYSVISEYSVFDEEDRAALGFVQLLVWGGFCFAPLVLPGALIAILRPQGGLQDILSGTSLAPRRTAAAEPPPPQPPPLAE